MHASHELGDVWSSRTWEMHGRYIGSGMHARFRRARRRVVLAHLHAHGEIMGRSQGDHREIPRARLRVVLTTSPPPGVAQSLTPSNPVRYAIRLVPAALCTWL